MFGRVSDGLVCGRFKPGRGRLLDPKKQVSGGVAVVSAKFEAIKEERPGFLCGFFLWFDN